ncbi:TBC1 domain family member 30 [Clonorchis sinensis]|uniref:TBC1 domain family member 30 n=1 Tax=Clonorchis sinensis TaxID=79923 RepID=G7YVH3_CLOSI|nr:TBC1 domain family member 30 [Clonorchis sinensis]
MSSTSEASDGRDQYADEEVENNPPQAYIGSTAVFVGRRGPGIYRHANLQCELNQRGNGESAPGLKRLSGPFKPSLTPGLGTRRVVNLASSHDKEIKFSMEPRPGDEAFCEWREAVRLMARLGDGLPKFVRRRVWSTLADRQLAKQHVDWQHVVRLAFNDRSNPDDDSLGSQIVKDLHRTGCEQFGSDEDRAALKRVLLAYARWNKRVGYCQGFNVIAAAILDVMDRDEKEAFKIMVYLIDYVLPESYFAQNLQALSVDIAVFRHLLQTKISRLSAHLDRLQYKAAVEANSKIGQPVVNPSQSLSGRAQSLYEPPLMNVYIIQWFLTLFATCLAPEAVLRIWDSILLEGSEVILRTAIVIMDFLASRLMKLKSADQFYGTMTKLVAEFAEGRIVSTRELLFEIYQLAPFPCMEIKELREKFTYNISPLVWDPITENKTNLAPHSKTASGQTASGVKRFRLLIPWRSEWKRAANETQSTTKDSNGALVGKDASDSRKDCTIPESNGYRRKENNQATSSSQDDDGYQEVSLAPPVRGNPKRKFSLFPNKMHKNSSAVDGSQQKNSYNLATTDDNQEQVIGLDSSSFTISLPQSNRILCHSSEALDSLPSRKQRTPSNTSPSDTIYIGRKQTDRRLSLPISHTASDISKIGPGAVGETVGPKPNIRSPLAHRARMSTKLTELKSQYRRQINRQRHSTLLLPDMWSWEECTPTNRIRFNETIVTAVLPQSRQSKPMDFVTSFHLNGQHLLTEHYPVDTSQQSHITDDVFFDPVGNSSKTFTAEPSRKSSIILLSDLREALLVDPDLQCLVRRWQAKADWSSRPLSSDVMEESEAVQLNHVCEAVEGQQATKTKAGETTAGNEESKNLRNSRTKQPQFNQLTLRELADSMFRKTAPHLTKVGEGTLSGVSTSDADGRTSPEMPVGTSGTSSSTSSTDEPRKFNTPLPNDVFYNILSEHIARQNGISSSDYLDPDEQQDSESSVTETDSYYTSVSQQATKKAPWEDSALFCRKRTSVTPVTKPTIGLQLPLSPTRRQFGAQFGLYKTIPSHSNHVLSTFCDRVQYVNLTRHALNRLNSNFS